MYWIDSDLRNFVINNNFWFFMYFRKVLLINNVSVFVIVIYDVWIILVGFFK